MSRHATESAETPAAPPTNGQPKTPKVIAGTTLPAPAPDSEVTISGELPNGAKVKYEARAEDVPQVTTQPKISAEQLARLQTKQYQEARIRYTNLTEWLEFWRDVLDLYKEKIASRADFEYANVTRFKMNVTRKIDPPLFPDQTSPFNNPCTTERPLGEWAFPLDVNLFIGHLQKINGGSGGEFRVELRDAEGSLIARSWFDERNQPLEGQENAIWEGQIPNPFNTVKPKEERESKPKEDELTILAKDMLRKKLEKVITGEDEQRSGSSLLTSIDAQAAAAVVSTLKETLTAIHSTAGNPNGGSDKGFFRSLAEGDEGQKRIWSGFDNVTNLLSMVAGDWIKGRNERMQHKQRMEELKMIQENPELAKVYQQQQQQATEQKQAPEDIYDYICRAIEEKRTDFTLDDPKIKEMSAADVAIIRGTLSKDIDANAVLDLFIQVAQFKGKGERARALKSLPQTLQFIERLQRSAKGA